MSARVLGAEYRRGLSAAAELELVVVEVGAGDETGGEGDRPAQHSELGRWFYYLEHPERRPQ